MLWAGSQVCGPLPFSLLRVTHTAFSKLFFQMQLLIWVVELGLPRNILSQGPRAFYPLSHQESLQCFVPLHGLWKHKH